MDISQEDQEDLHVNAQGKSINAVRSFVGEGVLVWGARTLDGNSLDWRYVNVRRTVIMLEESCRLAAKAMVFEPNVANTWLTIKAMISNSSPASGSVAAWLALCLTTPSACTAGWATP